MSFPIPDFVPVPGAEIMKIISLVSLIVGICFVGVGFLFQFLNRKKEKKATGLWTLIGVGMLLIVNHSLQLLF